MKRQTGYYATQRRHGRARAHDSRLHRLSSPVVRPVRRRRFVMQSHAVGRGDVSTAHLIGVAVVVVIGAVLVGVWARRR